jgi:hypothetical protein
VVDIKLEVGALNQRVTADVPMIKAGNASVGQVIESNEPLINAVFTQGYG